MPLSLTCVCGARFELEDTLAGQTITCPECQQPLKAPTLQKTPLRTSNLALTSMVLALVGAFTLIGSAVAVLLGMLALADIARHRDRIAGVGLALFGIIAGLALTTLTGFALFSGEVFGLAGNFREAMLAEHVDNTGSLEIVDRAAGFAITRPSRKWGVAVNKTIADPFVEGLLHPQDADLLLVQTTRYVFLDVRNETVAADKTLRECEQGVLEEFQPEQIEPMMNMNRRGFRPPPRARQPGDPERKAFPPTGYSLKSSRNFEIKGGEGRELQVDVKCGNKTWPFLIRLIRTPANRLYIVQAFAPNRKIFKDAETEIQEALDSFRLLSVR